MDRFKLTGNVAVLRNWLEARGIPVEPDQCEVDRASLERAGIDTSKHFGAPSSFDGVFDFSRIERIEPSSDPALSQNLLAEKLAATTLSIEDRCGSMGKRLSDLARAISSTDQRSDLPSPDAFEALFEAIRTALPGLELDMERSKDPQIVHSATSKRVLLRQSYARFRSVLSRRGLQAPELFRAGPSAPPPPSIETLLRTGTPRGKIEARHIQCLTFHGDHGESVRGVLKIGTPSPWMECLDITREAFPRGESVTYGLAQTLGCAHLVAETYFRELDGTPASVQRFRGESLAMSDAARFDLKLDLTAFEQLRVVDFIAGNWDRASRNVVIEKGPDGYRPVGIDSSMSFILPKGRFAEIKFQMPDPEAPTDTLSPETMEFIRGIDERAVLRFLRSEGIPKHAVRLAMARVLAIKADPSLVHIDRAEEAMKHLLAVELNDQLRVELRALLKDPV